METSKLSVAVFSILAMVLMTSYGDTANAATHRTVNHASKSHTQTGLIDTTKNGVGTYKVTKVKDCNGIVITKTSTFANGNTVTTTDDIIKNANGSKTMDITTNWGNGKTVNTDETITANGSITGTITQANGKVDQVTGTKDKTSYGTDTVLMLTNAKGQTENINSESLKSSDAVANVVTGTGFNGQAINNASLQTTNTAPKSNTVDTTVDGLWHLRHVCV